MRGPRSIHLALQIPPHFKSSLVFILCLTQDSRGSALNRHQPRCHNWDRNKFWFALRSSKRHMTTIRDVIPDRATATDDQFHHFPTPLFNADGRAKYTVAQEAQHATSKRLSQRCLWRTKLKSLAVNMATVNMRHIKGEGWDWGEAATTCIADKDQLVSPAFGRFVIAGRIASPDRSRWGISAISELIAIGNENLTFLVCFC